MAAPFVVESSVQNTSDAFRNSTPGAASVLLNPDIMSVVTQFTATHALDATCRGLHQVNYEVGIFRLSAGMSKKFIESSGLKQIVGRRTRNPESSILLDCRFTDLIASSQNLSALENASVRKLTCGNLGTVLLPDRVRFSWNPQVGAETSSLTRFVNLCETRSLRSLESLEISTGEFRDLGHLHSLMHLRHLDLPTSHISEPVLEAFACTHRNLETLVIGCGNLSSLEVLKCFPNLRTLELTGRSGVRLSLKPLSALSRLEHLTVPQVLFNLRAALQLPKTLRVLHIRGSMSYTDADTLRYINPKLTIEQDFDMDRCNRELYEYDLLKGTSFSPVWGEMID